MILLIVGLFLAVPRSYAYENWVKPDYQGWKDFVIPDYNMDRLAPSELELSQRDQARRNHDNMLYWQERDRENIQRQQDKPTYSIKPFDNGSGSGYVRPQPPKNHWPSPGGGWNMFGE